MDSKHFGEYYYAYNCGKRYARTEKWLDAFDRMAKRIVEDFNPGSVLDAGCAWGFLVERLRARGVAAWGIDLSEYAIQNVHPSVREFCWVGSITDPLPQKYDLIVSVEVFEHMLPLDSERAIENLCMHTDNILVSSSPFDYKEATHFNVQQPDYWAREFARHGFFHDVDYNAEYITAWAIRFHRLPAPSIQMAVQAYERKLWQLKTENKDLRSSVFEYHKQLEAQHGQYNLGDAELSARLKACEERWRDLKRNRVWRLLMKIQAFRVKLFPPGSARESVLDRLFRR